MTKRHIAILGNGIAGITAARHLRKRSDHEITVISKESDYFWSRTALMYIYMGHMELQHTQPYENDFWRKNRIDLRRGRVQNIDFDQKTLRFADGATMPYDALLLATGSCPRTFGWSGEDLPGVQSMISLQDLERMEESTRGIERAVVVGGGLIGIEMAEMLRSRNITTTLLIREDTYWSGTLPAEESAMVSRHIAEHHIDLRSNEELAEILPDAQGRVRAIRTKNGEEISCQFVGLTTGVRPQVDFLRDTPLEVDRGILVDDYLATNLPDVYALGDCAQVRSPQPGRQPIEAVWYVGRMMGECVAQTLTGQRTPYRPGHWFNSAKFLDIEWQVYGKVPSARADTADLDSLYWEGAEGKRAVRLVFARADQRVVGFNVMGVRLRHAVCDRWLAEERTLRYVLEHLEEANFDPEFFERPEPAVREAYAARFPDAPPLRPARRRGLFSRMFG